MPKSIEEKVKEFRKRYISSSSGKVFNDKEMDIEYFLTSALTEIYTQGKSDATQDILKLSERGPKDSIFDRIVPTIDIENYAKKLDL